MLYNHVVFAVDASSSMAMYAKTVPAAFDRLLASMAAADSAAGQKTDVSLVTFASTVQTVYLSKPIKEVGNLVYRPSGNTALIDGALRAIHDLSCVELDAYRKKSETEDHAYLMIVLTDGEENVSKHKPDVLRQKIAGLSDRWTVAIMVPNQMGVHHAKSFGFPAGNIEIWDISSVRGFEEAATTMADSYSAYTTLRQSGATRSTGFFTVNADNITKKQVKAALKPINGVLYVVDATGPIRPFVEGATGKPIELVRCITN